ncbi:MAG: histidine phosphatase family protein [Amaricoccus sp.]|uniref:SixA phosphatase family protein n=1 Tax=Amaricoccus sp. TaxID=1872485 RepID=UPI0039E3D4F5
MRRLILMRHAKSSWADPGQRDLDRPLNKRGRKAAALVGAWLRDRGYLPELALVSSARRTQETWAGVVAATGAAPTMYLPELYHAAANSMLAALHTAPDAGTVLILGHQPGIAAFAGRLVATPPDDEEFAKFPTTATAVIDFDVEGWPAVDWGTGRLIDFVVPRALE